MTHLEMRLESAVVVLGYVWRVLLAIIATVGVALLKRLLLLPAGS